MVLDCNIILGGYVGSYAEPYMSDIWRKASERDTFADDERFVESCRYGIGAAALGAALDVYKRQEQERVAIADLDAYFDKKFEF